MRSVTLSEGPAAFVVAVIDLDGRVHFARSTDDNLFAPARGLAQPALATLAQKFWHEFDQERRRSRDFAVANSSAVRAPALCSSFNFSMCTASSDPSGTYGGGIFGIWLPLLRSER